MPRHLNKFLTTLSAALLLLSAANVSPAGERGTDEKGLRQAEKILSKLSQLEAVSTSAGDYKSALRKFYPELFVNVSELRDGDLKTDLSTAVFLYQKAGDLLGRGDASLADCGMEVRDLYRNLCLAHAPQTRAQFLILKAGLHTRWAEALVRFSRGNLDAETMTTVSELRRERATDLVLAARALSLLQSLAEKVNASHSLAEFEAHGRVAEVSYDQLSGDFTAVAAKTRQLLASLPRSPFYYQLQNALSSYGDGLFYWQKTHRRRELVVSASNWTAPEAGNTRGPDAFVFDYTVICNWRNARKYLASAALEIERAGNKRAASE